MLANSESHVHATFKCFESCENDVSVDYTTLLVHCTLIYSLFLSCLFSEVAHTNTSIEKLQLYIIDCFSLTIERTFYIK